MGGGEREKGREKREEGEGGGGEREDWGEERRLGEKEKGGEKERERQGGRDNDTVRTPLITNHPSFSYPSFSAVTILCHSTCCFMDRIPSNLATTLSKWAQWSIPSRWSERASPKWLSLLTLTALSPSLL